VERLAFLGANSVYVGNGAAMTIFASAAGLQVRAGSGAETVFDATGTMAVSFAVATQGVTLTSDLTALIGGGAAAGDTFIGAGTFRLTAFRDEVSLNGDANPPSFFLGAGDDSIVLTQPRNEFTSFTGPFPVFDGGEGNDVLATVTYEMTASMFGGAGNDALSSRGSFSMSDMSGGTGDDVITGVTGFEGAGGRIAGDEGNDTITVQGRSFLASGGVGDDTISATYFVRGRRSELLEGNDGQDTLTVHTIPLEGPDTADPTVIVVNGGAGNDTITGERHNGWYWASSREHFAVNDNWGDDVIFNFDDDTDSEGGDDFILFENTAASGLDSFDDLTVTQGVGFTLVSFGTNSIRLEGITATSFTADDVLFS
jgi:hypothetical protein